MSGRLLKKIFILAAVVILAGCSSAGITTRTYVEDRERVDQDMSGGNYGYLYGQPQPEDRAEYKKTRKVYVVEFTKEDESVVDEPIVVTRTKTVYLEPEPAPQPKQKEPEWARPVDVPTFTNDEPAAEAAPGNVVEYTVQKNDTLQKISKKFYDTYRKWPQIYELNKEKIRNPDKIKPGIVLQIPVD